MRPTETYRKHHQELRAIASRIEAVLDAAAITADPSAAVVAVRELFGKFSIHLALEDNSLYPRCLRHDDLDLRQIATRFQTEMGDLGTRFDSYKRSWPGPLAIARNPPQFVADTITVLALLKTRVAREESEFYDIVDKVA
ncbi:hemerythrin domain-containing protein [Magnetospirillum sulfuroxidans]|uniref:Hemerythrin domain-containing protein n=1 Tax=Magnetospirillum sulfuroxidans TaxID=611300 RepID=A0ABS5IAZ5_9PROT|nr:hemerythrin domain-containing protein [Magnetospirillum sulfuroxidans]MBR9970928.1 hemerythrin domain-containing protein [Magnetospirillum sulfuroxidans]